MKNANLIKAYSILLLSAGASSVLLSLAWQIVYSALSWKGVR